MQQLEDFANTVTAFCEWAESCPGDPNEDAEMALRLVSRLFAQALDLPSIFDDEDAPAIPHEEWAAMYKRFGSLPFNFYSSHLEPANVPDPTPGIGDLADDLADIWRDLKGGLDLYRKGNHAAAATEWRVNFEIHWGRHAASALYALWCWRS